MAVSQIGLVGLAVMGQVRVLLSETNRDVGSDLRRALTNCVVPAEPFPQHCGQRVPHFSLQPLL
jgi:hypothetical protein